MIIMSIDILYDLEEHRISILHDYDYKDNQYKFRILWKEPMHTNSLFLLLVIIVPTLTQVQIVSMNRCLGNCAVCKNDDMATCSGQEMLNCVKGYDGVNCPLKSSYSQLVLMPSQTANVMPAVWQTPTVNNCTYLNYKKQTVYVYTLGMDLKVKKNVATIDVTQNYHNFLVSFNLIRDTWTPYRDILHIQITDQLQDELGTYFIEFVTRSEINPAVNLLRCGKAYTEPMMIDRYQMEGDFSDSVGKVTKMMINFQADLVGESDWGLTNVKVLFGCMNGYYAARTNKKGCQLCPLNCQTCTESSCSVCSDGYTLKDSKCTNNYTLTVFPIGNRSLTCPFNRTFLPSSTVAGQQVLQIQLSALPVHKKVRLILNIAYSASQWNSTSDKINVQLDGKQVITAGTNLKGPLVQQYCDGFAGKGTFLYSYYRIVTPYIDHTADKLKAVLTGPAGKKIAAYEVGFEYEAIPDPPKNQTSPTVPPTNSTAPLSQSNTTNASLPKNTTSGTNATPSSSTNTVPTNNQVPVTNTTSPANSTPTTTTNATNNGSQPVKPTANTADSTNSIAPIADKPDNKTNSNSNTNANNVPASNNTNTNNNNNTSTNSNTNTNTNTNSNTTNNSTNSNNNTNSTSNATTPQNNSTPTNNNNNSNSNTNSNTNNNSNNNMKTAQQVYMAQVITNISSIKDQLIIGIRSATNLVITVQYPYVIDKFPFITILRDNNNQTIIPHINVQNLQYQELAISPSQSWIDQNLSIIMSDTNPLQVAKRNLQATTNAPVSASIGQVNVARYDHLGQSQWDSVARYAGFFQAISWIVIISTIVLSFMGNSIITQQCSLLLQLVFLHVYIFTQYLPVNFKLTIGGLQRMQTLDYFQSETGNSIQHLLLGNVIQYSPAKFTLFNKDINFTRAAYPTVIITIAYLIWFCLLNLVRKIIQPSLMLPQNQQEYTWGQKAKLLLVRTAQRVLNFWYQVWQYQFIVYIFAFCVQLHNMSYPSDANRSQVANMIFCFLVMLLMVTLPIVTVLYLNRRYFRLDYFQYCYWYQSVFYLKLPQQSLPSNHHRIMIIIRNIRYILCCICFSFLGSYPVQSLVILILVNIFSMLYIKLSHLQPRVFLGVIHIIQHILLILLEIAMIVAYAVSHIFTTNQYMIIGHVLTTICLLTVVVGFVRVGYYIYSKVVNRNMQKQVSQFKPAIGTQRVV